MKIGKRKFNGLSNWEFVKSIEAMLNYFSQEVLNKDPTVWLDGARRPPNSEFDKITN
jgi:hypothetical protein